MTPAPPGRPALSRSALVVGLLALTVAVTAALTWEAISSARRARHTAEGVLREYAAVTAVQFVREVEARLTAKMTGGLDGVRHTLDGHPPRGAMPSPDACDCLPPSGATAFVVTAAEPAAPPGLTLDPALIASLRDDLDDLPGPHRLHAGRLRLHPAHGVVVSRVEHRAGTSMAVGFVVSDTFLTDVFRLVIDTAALLPGTLAGTDAHRGAIGIRVRDGDGRELFAAGPLASPYTGTAALAPRLGGLRVDAAIPGELAPALIIGGLPSDRWPLAIGLLTLAIGLVIAAALQWRRELRFARGRADFVSSVSHELRTPLAQIRLYGETLLLERVRSRDEQHRAAAVIVQESRRLSQMVDNILLFSRAGRGGLIVRRDRVNPAVLTRETVDGFRPQAASKAMTIEVAADDAPDAVSVDPNALRQILLNLLDNAVKYGPRGQTIRVAVSGAPGRLRIAVADDGPGVPAADRGRIWQPFWRAAGSSEGGTGLGLAIVRDLALEHDGTVTIEPAHEDGTGARFIVTLAAV